MIHLKKYKKFQSNSNWVEAYDKLERNFNFPDFKRALKFINDIITEKDIKLAKLIDECY